MRLQRPRSKEKKKIAVEQYGASLEYAKVRNLDEVKAIAASITLTKEWVAAEHPSIDPSSNDRFLAQCKRKDGMAKQSKTFGHTSKP